MQQFIGIEELPSPIEHMREKPQSKLAKNSLQCVFNGLTGFSFPVCHYPVVSYTAAELRLMVDKVIHALHKYGFQV